MMIGCADGTLATMLYRAACNVTVVDINPHAFVFARKHFGLPDGVECVVEDGLLYVARMGHHFDAIAYRCVRCYR
jgi:spermidine synthase